MKKKILAVLMAIIFVVATGCAKSDDSESKQDSKSMFTTVETGWNWKVVYQTETRVMYIVSAGSYNGGSFTLMVDADGNPLLWQE